MLEEATMFVLSSDFEGIPNSLLEAMALGVPCISTDCSPGGAALLIKPNINGILVPKGDVEALANAMKYYVQHPNIAEQYGEQAKYVNEEFSEEKIIPMWLRAFEIGKKQG